MVEGVVSFGLLNRMPYASSTGTGFNQFKRFLLELSPFPGNIRRVAPGLSLAVNTLHNNGLRNPSGKGMYNKVLCREAPPEVKSANHTVYGPKPSYVYAAKQHSEKIKFCVVYA